MEGVSVNVEAEDEGVDDEGSGVDLSTLGDDIAATVREAAGADDEAEVEDGGVEGVSSATTLTLDNTPGTAISDASGGDNNFAFVS